MLFFLIYVLISKPPLDSIKKGKYDVLILKGGKFMQDIIEYQLKSNSGFTVKILNLGGIITEIMAKDQAGNRSNVVLNYEDFTDYWTNPLFIGCFVGPVAGRTLEGKLPLGEQNYQLDCSINENALHSGKDGLHNVIWSLASSSEDHVKFTLIHPYLEANPFEVIYELTYSVKDEALTIEYTATPSEPAYLSLTNHSYFNLSGNLDTSIESHYLKLNASHYARMNALSLPIQLVPLKDSDLDFSESRPLSEIIHSDAEDITGARGIDHPFKANGIDPLVELTDPQSGRKLRVKTTQPYSVIYSGNYLDSTMSSSGHQFNNRTGICFETQDLTNVANSNLDELKLSYKDQPYKHQTAFDFDPN